MANAFLSVLRGSRRFLGGPALRLTPNPHVIAPALSRSLYSRDTLGLDSFEQQQRQVRQQLTDILKAFKEKMKVYSEDDKSMIFTEDLKNMAHVVENDSEIEVLVKMMKKFNQQNKQMRFGNFVFGPVVMRLFHLKNKPELALECFMAPEMNGFFDQLISYQILMDLLFENKMYNEILKTFDVIRERQLEGMRNPKNAVVLVMAACYKLNTEESLKYALNLWQNLTAIGHFPMRRAATFCAALALNQGRYAESLEILAGVTNNNYTTVRNLKVACLVGLGRLEDAMPILKSVINNDQASAGQPHTFNKDVLDRVRAEVTRLNDPALTLEFDKLDQMFMKQGHISDRTLDEQLCAEIQRPPMMNNRQDFNSYGRYERRDQRDQNSYGRYERRDDRRDYRYQSNQRYQDRNNRGRGFQRPGLAELE